MDAAVAAAVRVFTLPASVAGHQSRELRTERLARARVPTHARAREEAGFAAQQGRHDLAADDRAALRALGVSAAMVAGIVPAAARDAVD
eukprot:3536624-Alexandrium_andersonii.AAC.1